MRTALDIDRGLLEAAMAATGLATKKATIEQALRSLVDRHRQKNAIADLAGIGCEGDLDEIRQSPLTIRRPGGRADRRCSWRRSGSRACRRWSASRRPGASL
ncbi:type II toxin-antitoxin system VapB family antitoxin [Rhizobium lentis]|nr:type II toxin-antitoxin system VapB family antitoxin [Rhizobium lentis]